MFESGVGFNTIVRRQCSGIGCGAGAPACGGGPPAFAGGLNTPAATDVAFVIVVRSRVMVPSCSHGMLSAPASWAAMRVANMVPPGVLRSSAHHARRRHAVKRGRRRRAPALRGPDAGRGAAAISRNNPSKPRFP